MARFLSTGFGRSAFKTADVFTVTAEGLQVRSVRYWRTLVTDTDGDPVRYRVFYVM